MLTNRRTVAPRQRGMSLVELMVGMLIGLIGIIIITHVYVTNDQQKRATTAAGGAQTNAAIALFALERDIRQAGFGLNHSRAFACNCNWITNVGCSTIQYHYAGTYSFPPAGSLTGARNALSLYPFLITDLPNQPDTLSVFYGSDNERVLGSTIFPPGMINAGSDIPLDGTAGFEVGNIIVVQNGATCSVMEVTAVLPAALQHNGGNWNPAGGGALPFYAATTSMVFNLGSAPVWRTYGILNGKLQVTDGFRALTQGAVSEDIMDSIVDLQAQYGKDTNSDGVVDLWTKQLPTVAGTNFTATDIQQIIAVRIAVLARSEELVKPVVPGVCDATTAGNRPSWIGAIVTANNPVAAPFATFDAPGALPSCYKYRAMETIVPLRNMIWRPE